MRAAELTWPEMKTLAEQGAFALVPAGSTEAHGPHLPLSVDVVIAEEVARRVVALLSARGQQAVIFPALCYGLTDFAARFSGTVSVSGATTTQYLSEVLCGIATHGFKTIGVLNHHVEPAHFKVVHQAAKTATAQSGARIVVPDHRRKPFVAQLGEEFTSGGSHAGEYETSLMLAAAPQLVREELRRKLAELAIDLPGKIKAGAKNFHEAGGPDAYFGAPAKATAAEGERLFGLLAELSVEALLSAG